MCGLGFSVCNFVCGKSLEGSCLSPQPPRNFHGEALTLAFACGALAVSLAAQSGRQSFDVIAYDGSRNHHNPKP